MQDLDKNRNLGPGKTHTPDRGPHFSEDRALIRNVLVLASEYDRTRLEEKGSLVWHLNRRYSKAESSILPRLEFVDTLPEAREYIDRVSVDLLIVVCIPVDQNLDDLVRSMKGSSPETISFYASNSCNDLPNGEGPWDHCFQLTGGEDVPRLVQIAEDMRNISSDRHSVVAFGPMDIGSRSRLAFEAADIIWEHVCGIAKTERSLPRRISLITDRPKVVILKFHEDLKRLGDRVALLIPEEGTGPAGIRESLCLGDLLIGEARISEDQVMAPCQGGVRTGGYYRGDQGSGGDR